MTNKNKGKKENANSKQIRNFNSNSSSLNELENGSDEYETDSGSIDLNMRNGNEPSSSFRYSNANFEAVGPENGPNRLYAMDCLIPVVNKLQEVLSYTGSDIKIDLPQIAVVGGESVGKSSLLESLVGKPFLPKGKGIVTRCPIVIKLINTLGTAEWAEFYDEVSENDNENEGNDKGEKKPRDKFEIKNVCNEIKRRTDVILEGKNTVSKRKIHLTIYSPHVTTLTVVDLPGVVRVRLDGQDEDIVQKTEEMVTEFVTPDSTIILAVSSAVNGISQSEGLKIAKKVDPDRNRTLAVFTNLDVAQDYTDELSGKLLNIKLGIIGVVNRTDEDGSKTPQEVLAKERNFFMQKYPSLAPQSGIPYLAQRLKQILVRIIVERIPRIEDRIKMLKNEYEDRLKELGPLSNGQLSDDEKSALLIKIIQDFTTNFRAQIEGKTRDIGLEGLYAKSRLEYLFGTLLVQDLDSINPTSDISDEKIIIAISNSNGLLLKLHTPIHGFSDLVRREIIKMKDLALVYAAKVYEEMQSIIQLSLDPSLDRFPKVNRTISKIANELIHKRYLASKESLTEFIEVHAYYATTTQESFYKDMEKESDVLKAFNLIKITSELLIRDLNDKTLSLSTAGKISKFFLSGKINDDFFKRASSLLTPSQNGDQNAAPTPVDTSSNNLACKFARALINSFFEIVRDDVKDYIPKQLIHSLIYHSITHIQSILTVELHKKEKLDELIQESQEIIATRNSVLIHIESLERASAVIDEIRKF